ncbi:MAG: PDDEXK nuclease domain-containing protein [Syntrophales bacterium]
MKNANDPSVVTSPEYRKFIENLKARVVSARISAVRAVSLDLILLYWDIGRGIVEKQQVLGWGDAVVEMVAADLRRAFPQITGFSSRNVWDMRRLYTTCTAPDFLSQVVRENDHGEGGKILRQVVAEFGGDKKRGEGDQPSIGIILCAEKDDVEVEYALRTKANPIGVAAYQLQSKLPADLKGKLPTAKQLADVLRAALPERNAT